MRNVLVTGGCGFIGRNFVRRLIKEPDVRVFIVDDLSAGLHPRHWLDKKLICQSSTWAGEERVMFTQADLRSWFDSHLCWFDTVIHCAANVGGRTAMENDPLWVATSMAIDADLFWWLAREKATRTKVIYFSSSAAYPICYQQRDDSEEGPSRRLLREDLVHPTEVNFVGRPDRTYGWTKLTGEVLAHYAVKTHGLDVVIYRPFGGYGEDQSDDYPVPAIVKRVLAGEDPVVVWGSGDQQRDFIHVDDIVEAVLATKDKLKPGEALNLGTGIPTSFKQIAEAAWVLADRGFVPNVVNDPTKPEGVFSRVADVTKLSRFYQPKITLTEGLQRMIRALDTTPKEV